MPQRSLKKHCVCAAQWNGAERSECGDERFNPGLRLNKVEIKLHPYEQNNLFNSLCRTERVVEMGK